MTDSLRALVRKLPSMPLQNFYLWLQCHFFFSDFMYIERFICFIGSLRPLQLFYFHDFFPSPDFHPSFFFVAFLFLISLLFLFFYHFLFIILCVCIHAFMQEPLKQREGFIRSYLKTTTWKWDQLVTGRIRWRCGWGWPSLSLSAW